MRTVSFREEKPQKTYKLRPVWVSSPSCAEKLASLSATNLPRNDFWGIPAWERTTTMYLEAVQIWVAVSNIFYFHPSLGKWSNLTSIFSNGLKPPTRDVRSTSWFGEKDSVGFLVGRMAAGIGLRTGYGCMYTTNRNRRLFTHKCLRLTNYIVYV